MHCCTQPGTEEAYVKSSEVTQKAKGPYPVYYAAYQTRTLGYEQDMKAHG